MTIYVTSCALKLGIRQFELSDEFTMSDAVTFFGKEHVHISAEKAKTQAEQMRVAKIDYLQSKINRLQAIKF